jgi:hypothetical protein
VSLPDMAVDDVVIGGAGPRWNHAS